MMGRDVTDSCAVVAKSRRMRRPNVRHQRADPRAIEAPDLLHPRG